MSTSHPVKRLVIKQKGFESVKEKGPGRTLNVHCAEVFVLQSHVQERAVCGNKVAY